MNKIKAYAAITPKTPLELFTIDRRVPQANDIVIDIKYCGICHSDIHLARDEWRQSNFPMVPGHEIVGIITQIGSKVKKFKIGDQVGVGCVVDSCRHCTNCKHGQEQHCLKGFSATYGGYEQDGKTLTYGGYSENIVVDENYVLKIPNNLPLDKAAPLLCAGITLYAPLKRWQVGPGKKVAILGLGGLGHIGVKLAHALGAEVSVLSHSVNKQSDAQQLGADHFYATTNSEIFEQLANTFDVIINTISIEIDFAKYLALLKTNGTMVLVGLSAEPYKLSAFSLIRGDKNLAGSLIGGIEQTQEMLDFCGQHNITCDIELINIDKINEAYERVIKSDVRYRFVIDMATLK